MKQTEKKPQRTPFSLSRFITSTLGYFIIFSAIVGMFYLADPNMLKYNFLFISSAIVAVILGVYHAKYKKQTDIDIAVDTDINHIEEEIEEISEKLHKKSK